MTWLFFVFLLIVLPERSEQKKDNGIVKFVNYYDLYSLVWPYVE